MSEAVNKIQDSDNTEDDTQMSMSRVEAFSDGVFAVAITLLVLNLVVPHFAQGQNTPGTTLSFLADQWPVYFSYFISFLSIGSVWIGHHQAFKLVKTVDATFQLANIICLMLITLLPFTTALLAEYLRNPTGKDGIGGNNGLIQIGIIIYSLQWIVMGVLLMGMLRYARLGGLLKPNADLRVMSAVTRRLGVSAIVFGGVGLIAALFNPTLSVFFYLIITVYYLFPLLGLFNPTKGRIHNLH